MLRDPLLLGGIFVWVVSILPSLFPVLPESLTVTWADIYSDVPMLGFVLGAVVLAIRDGRSQRERLFWRLLAGTLLFWLGVRGLYVFVPLDQWGTWTDLMSDVLYLAGYLTIAFGMEWRPDIDPGAGQRARLGQAETVAILLFGFGLLTYFVLIPSVFNPEVYESWVSSLLFYAVLDVYLVIRMVFLWRSCSDGRWRPTYAWLLVVFVLWLIGDLIEGFMYLGTLAWVDPGTPLDLVWHLPSLGLLLAVRSRRWWLAEHSARRA